MSERVWKVVLERQGKQWGVTAYEQSQIRYFLYSKWPYVLERLRKLGFNKNDKETPPTQ